MDDTDKKSPHVDASTKETALLEEGDWVHSTDENTWTCTQRYRTREIAEADATRCCVPPGAPFFTGRIVSGDHVFGVTDGFAEGFIDSILDQAYSEYAGEDIEEVLDDWSERLIPSSVALKRPPEVEERLTELATLLETAWRQWLHDHGLEPPPICTIERITPHTAPGKTAEGSMIGVDFTTGPDQTVVQVVKVADPPPHEYVDMGQKTHLPKKE